MTGIFNLRKSVNVIIIFLAAVLIIAAIGFYTSTPANAATDVQATKNTLAVSGSGKVEVTPDIAYVSLGVVTENTVAKTAQTSNATLMDKVVSQIKAQGIKTEDIKTVNYSISPKYSYDQKTGISKIIGYTVSNTLNVTIRDLKKTGSIIDLATTNGVNNATSISFGLSDYDKYYNEALKKSVDVAKLKAKTLADSFGVKINIPVTITEGSGYNPVYSYANDSAKALASSVVTPIQAGTMEVSASVTLVYEY